MTELFNLIIDVAQDSFIAVTTFVGATLVIFGYINYKKEGKLIEAIENKKRWQPVIGALLGLTPGCGGAILVMPLFGRGHVSFGAVVATLIATAGDAAFVLISQVPLDFLKISAIAFVTAIITGYLVDFIGIKPKVTMAEKCKNRRGCGCDNRKGITHIGHNAGDEICEKLHQKGHQKEDTLGYKITHQGYLVYIAFLVVGLIYGVIGLTGISIEYAWFETSLVVIGVIGAILSIVLVLAGKKYFAAETHEEEEMKLMSLKETLIHNSEETAFVGTWVFAAYMAYGLAVYALGGGDYAAGEILMEEFVVSIGLASVLIGALIGMIPGCGPQIMMASLYATGTIPFGALVANVISQDGDALFPLIAMSKRSSIIATFITGFVAAIVGTIFYLI